MAATQPRARLHPFETVALGAVLMGLGGPALAGLPPTPDMLSRSLATLASTLLLAFVLGVGGQLLLRAGSRTRAADYLHELASPTWWVQWLRLWLACLATSTAYFWAKLCVPLLRPGPFDAALWRLDRGLHLGWSPNQWRRVLLRAERGRAKRRLLQRSRSSGI